jgi:hypothetical protein
MSMLLPAAAFTRRFAVIGGFLGLAAIAFLVLLNGTGGTAHASASAPPSYAAYPALNSTEATGLPLVTSHPQASAGTTTPSADPTTSTVTGPTFPVNPPPGVTEGWPASESIRKLNIDEPNISAWISKGIDGELCVLESPHQQPANHHGVAVSCTPASEISSGATVEFESPGSKVFDVVGVVPSSVPAVEVTLTNGAVRKIETTDNAWVLETETRIQTVRAAVGG